MASRTGAENFRRALPSANEWRSMRNAPISPAPRGAAAGKPAGRAAAESTAEPTTGTAAAPAAAAPATEAATPGKTAAAAAEPAEQQPDRGRTDRERGHARDQPHHATANRADQPGTRHRRQASENGTQPQDREDERYQEIECIIGGLAVPVVGERRRQSFAVDELGQRA